MPSNNPLAYRIVFAPKIKISRTLYEQLEEIAKEKQYTDAHDFIVETLEKAVEQNRSDGSEDRVKERLKGLGYIE